MTLACDLTSNLPCLVTVPSDGAGEGEAGRSSGEGHARLRSGRPEQGGGLVTEEHVQEYPAERPA